MKRKRRRDTTPSSSGSSPTDASGHGDVTLDAAEIAAAEAAPAGPFDLLPKLLPELTLTLAALVLAVSPDRYGPRVREGLTAVVLVEIFFCMGQATLTDVATRLKRSPPWWLGLLILGGIVLLNPDIVTITRGLFREGWPVFVPYAWSLVERGRELWTMPRASRLEKLRRRALVSGRMAILLIVAGTAVAVMCVSYVIDSDNGGAAVLEHTAGWWLLVAFALATYDVARVYRPAFARRPRALFGRFDPLGVRYLAPV